MATHRAGKIQHRIAFLLSPSTAEPRRNFLFLKLLRLLLGNFLAQDGPAGLRERDGNLGSLYIRHKLKEYMNFLGFLYCLIQLPSVGEQGVCVWGGLL